jgi:AcrR family transcriptional regulator
MYRIGRPQLYSDDVILDAARAVVLERGARAVTVSEIARASGAPKGSIYHRFAAQDDLLAAMWIRAVRRSQAVFLEALGADDPVAAAVAGALSHDDFARAYPGDARLLASLRREDVLQSVSSGELRRELADLNRPLEGALRRLARRLYGKGDRAAVERTVFAVVDLPIGAMRRHLIVGLGPPIMLRGQLEAAVRAALTYEGGKTNVGAG